MESSSKRIGIIGGTGDLGRGLAVRFSFVHEVLIGSRDEAKAKDAAQHVRGVSGRDVMGLTNLKVAEECEVAILSVPDLPGDDFIRELADNLQGKLVVSPVVPMKFSERLFTYTAGETSAAEKIAAALPRSRVSAALHTVPARKLLRTDSNLNFDVLVAAPTKEIFQETAAIISSIPGLTPMYAGPLSVAKAIEALTPLLLNVGTFSKVKDPSIKVVT